MKFGILTAIFLANLGLTGIYPMIPLYVKTLNSEHVAVWSGFIIGTPFLMSAIMGPIWARLAQTLGFKMILSLQAFCVALSLFLQSFADTALDLFLVRTIGNFFAGLIGSYFVYITFSSPKDQIGRNLTHGSIAASIGFMLGPGLLGMIAAEFGFKIAFDFSAVVILICLIINMVCLPKHTKLNFSKVKFDGFLSKLFGDIHLPKVRSAYLFVFALFAFLTVPTTLQSLMANEILRNSQEATRWVGLLSAIGAALGLILSFIISKYIDRVGFRRIFIATLLGSSISIASMGLAPTFVSFAVAFVVNLILQCEFGTLANLLTIEHSSSDSRGQAVVSTFSIIKFANFGGAVLAGIAAEYLPLGTVVILSAAFIFFATIGYSYDCGHRFRSIADKFSERSDASC
jgi:MFS family permease